MASGPHRWAETVKTVMRQAQRLCPCNHPDSAVGRGVSRARAALVTAVESLSAPLSRRAARVGTHASDVGALRAQDRHVLLSTNRLFGAPTSFTAAFGDPSQLAPEWCRAALDFLIETEYWAPEVHWEPSERAVLDVTGAENARWICDAAAQAGYAAQMHPSAEKRIAARVTLRRERH